MDSMGWNDSFPFPVLLKAGRKSRCTSTFVIALTEAATDSARCFEQYRI